MALDPTSAIGKIRLRVGDWSDLPIFPDAVYQTTLDDSAGNLPKAAQTMAQYILAALSQKSHKKMAQMEIWGSEAYKNYKDFLVTTINNPAFMNYSPLAYGVAKDAVTDPLTQFVNDWNNNWNNCTVSDNMRYTAWNNRDGLEV